MSKKVIILPEIGEVVLQKRDGNRSLRISIGAQGIVRVTLPKWAPYELARRFAISKSSWILEHRTIQTDIRQGARVGKAHVIEYISGAGSAPRTTLTGNSIRVHLPLNMPHHDPKAQIAARKGAVRAMKKEAEQLLPQRLKEFAEKYDFSYKSVVIKRLSTRWGTCDSQKNIALNCYLMQLPWHLIDYVLLHELVHTRVMAHGAGFWKELGNYVPNLASVRKEIRKTHPSL